MFYLLSGDTLTKGEPTKRIIEYSLKKGDLIHVVGDSGNSGTHVCTDARQSPFDKTIAYPSWRKATPEEEALIKTHILINGDST